MKRILIFLFLITSQLSIAQENNDVSIFHRLIIYNSNSEILLVRFENTNTWVTPGFYQDSEQLIKQGLHDIASTYNITVTDPKLKGVFSMKRENGKNNEMLIRNIYSCFYKSGRLKLPRPTTFTIAEAMWFTMEEALKAIPFESTRMFIKQIHDYPDQISGGSIHAKREGDKWNYAVLEEFYRLF